MRTLFAYSPDNRFAYINDLGSDCIYIYKLNAETADAEFKAGSYKAKAWRGAEDTALPSQRAHGLLGE
jgi:6-phosphogluconolactonase (cycloisomerase 2 family)